MLKLILTISVLALGAFMVAPPEMPLSTDPCLCLETTAVNGDCCLHAEYNECNNGDGTVTIELKVHICGCEPNERVHLARFNRKFYHFTLDETGSANICIVRTLPAGADGRPPPRRRLDIGDAFRVFGPLNNGGTTDLTGEMRLCRGEDDGSSNSGSSGSSSNALASLDGGSSSGGVDSSGDGDSSGDNNDPTGDSSQDDDSSGGGDCAGDTDGDSDGESSSDDSQSSGSGLVPPPGLTSDDMSSSGNFDSSGDGDSSSDDGSSSNDGAPPCCCFGDGEGGDGSSSHSGSDSMSESLSGSASSSGSLSSD